MRIKGVTGGLKQKKFVKIRQVFDELFSVTGYAQKKAKKSILIDRYRFWRNKTDAHRCGKDVKQKKLSDYVKSSMSFARAQESLKTPPKIDNIDRSRKKTPKIRKKSISGF